MLRMEFPAKGFNELQSEVSRARLSTCQNISVTVGINRGNSTYEQKQIQLIRILKGQLRA